MTKTEFMENLKAKLDTEWKAYKKSLSKMDVDDVIYKSYETTYREQIYCILESETEDRLEEQQIKRLLSIDNLLDFMYQEWMKTDVSDYDILTEVIFGDKTMEKITDMEKGKSAV